MVFGNLDPIWVCDEFYFDESFASFKVEMLTDARTQVEHEVEVKLFGVPNSCSVIIRPSVVYFLEVGGQI